MIYGSFGRQTQEKLYIASHGAGIFVFADGKLEANIDENYGLPSKNVNDMAAYQEGFFVATDNGEYAGSFEKSEMQSCFYKG